MPSVQAAAMNTAEASNSFSPFWLLKRLLEIIQISRGMLAMRISVMELGRFTLRNGSRDRPEVQLIILHGSGERNVTDGPRPSARGVAVLKVRLEFPGTAQSFGTGPSTRQG
jgi:hypothetical protein